MLHAWIASDSYLKSETINGRTADNQSPKGPGSLVVELEQDEWSKFVQVKTKIRKKKDEEFFICFITFHIT